MSWKITIGGHNVLYKFNHDYTKIIYRSEPDRKGKWTQNLSDIIDIKPGICQKKEAMKLCENYTD